MRIARFAALLGLLFAAVSVRSQQITITGQVIDPNGVPYTNGRGRVLLTPTNVFFTTGLTNPVPGSQSPVIIDGLDANGRFSVVLTSTAAIDQQTSNPQWMFTFCSAPILQFGPICFTGPILALTSSQDITAQISAVPPPVLPGGGAGGTLPAPPAGVLQKASNPPSAFSASNVSEPPAGNLAGVLSVAEDMSAKGPNPGVDVRQYGVRFCNPNTTPCSAGLTASTVSGSPNVTLSSTTCAGNPCFVNGDGIVVYGAGATQSMSTPSAPTVTPSIATAGTGTGQVSSTVPTGSTTYCYKVVAEDKGGGLTAASSETCTSTGAATIGAVNLNISSMSRSGDTVTVTTASAHGFNTSCNNTNCGEAYINNGNGLTDTTFQGWYTVVSAPSTTTFTIRTFADSRNGASTSATGGTVTFYNCNRVTWSAVAGAVRYYIYQGASGAETRYGTSMLQGANTDLTFDDFGSTLMGNSIFPAYVPTNPPNSATNDHLSATVLSGAGTSNMVLSANAGATLAAATILLDAAPGLKAAATAINGYIGAGALIIPVDPAGGNIVVNSYLDTSGLKFSVEQSGLLTLNGTWQVNNSPGSRWEGTTQSTTSPSDTWQANPLTTVNATPGLYFFNGFSLFIKGVTFRCGSGNSNNCKEVLTEGGFNMVFENDAFITGTTNNDTMGIGLYIRGSSGQSGANILIDKVLFSAGNSNNGVSHSGPFFCNSCGNITVRSAYYLHRGGIINVNVAGAPVKIDHSYINGGGTPLYTVYGNPINVRMGLTIMDTIPHPCLASFAVTTIQFPEGLGSCVPFSGVPPVTGVRNPVQIGMTQIQAITNLTTANLNRDTSALVSNGAGAQDGVFGQNDGPYTVLYNNVAVATSSNYPFFVSSAVPSTPACAVQAGGSLPIANYNFRVAPIWASGGEGVYSAASATCTTSTGNQTIQISWSLPPGSPKSMQVYFSQNGGGFAASNQFTNPFPAATTSFTWTTLGANVFVASLLPTAGPTMMMQGLSGVVAPLVTTNAVISQGTSSVSGCSLTASSGGSSAGKFSSGTTGTCTVTLTLPTAPNGWTCDAHDLTTAADANNVVQTAFTTTSATISGTTVSGDVITWKCEGW